MSSVRARISHLPIRLRITCEEALIRIIMAFDDRLFHDFDAPLDKQCEQPDIVTTRRRTC